MLKHSDPKTTMIYTHVSVQSLRNIKVPGDDFDIIKMCYYTKGDPIFQIQIKGNEISLAGFFRKKEGTGAIGFGPWLHEVQGRKGTIFKYPSSKYPGMENK